MWKKLVFLVDSFAIVFFQHIIKETKNEKKKNIEYVL